MDLQLHDKVAVVTGASKGIGLAVVTAFAEAGARVVAGSRHTNPALAALAERSAVAPIEVDLATPDGPARLVERAVAAFGGVDILVNNVGGLTVHPGGFLDITDADWQRTFDLDVVSGVRAARAVLPLMVARGRGTIVNVASLNARLPDATIADYSAAKAAVVNLSKALAEEFGPKGVRVNAVSPGPVRTALQIGPGGVADTLAGASGAERAAIVEQFPAMNQMALDRYIEPDEVAALVAFLASDRAAMITGVDYIIDGGMMKTV